MGKMTWQTMRMVTESSIGEQKEPVSLHTQRMGREIRDKPAEFIRGNVFSKKEKQKEII